MESDGQSGTIIYNSAFEYGVDEKRRVQIPAKWRPTEEGVELTLVLWPKNTEGPCLRVLPPKQMTELSRELAAMPNSDPHKSVLKRFIGRESAQVALDKGGRICIPEALARGAGIQDQAVLVGLIDRFEIWNPDRFKRVKAADDVLAQEAFKLME